MIGSEERKSYEDDVEEESFSLLQNVKSSRRSPISKSTFLRHWRFIAIQAVLITLYTGMFWILRFHWQSSPAALVYSPAQRALQYEKVRFNATLVIDSPYNGAPSPEVDKAWNDLLQNMNIAVPKSDLDKIGASSIAVPNTEDEYVAGLSVFHELHCLKRIRQYTWSEYYHAGLSEDEARLNRLHADHCIDILRQAILCHADISLFTLQWSEAETQPRADFSLEHTCVDWRALNDWAGQRRVEEDVLKQLQHPLHGSAFPNGEGSHLGASEDHSPTVHE